MSTIVAKNEPLLPKAFYKFLKPEDIRIYDAKVREYIDSRRNLGKNRQAEMYADLAAFHAGMADPFLKSNQYEQGNPINEYSAHLKARSEKLFNEYKAQTEAPSKCLIEGPRPNRKGKSKDDNEVFAIRQKNLKTGNWDTFIAGVNESNAVAFAEWLFANNWVMLKQAWDIGRQLNKKSNTISGGITWPWASQPDKTPNQKRYQYPCQIPGKSKNEVLYLPKSIPTRDWKVFTDEMVEYVNKYKIKGFKEFIKTARLTQQEAILARRKKAERQQIR